MIRGSCHCGAVKIQAPAVPTQLTSCNCSICRRLGCLMAYYKPADVVIDAAPGATVPYVWGDKMLAFHHCSTCGCTTHWEGIGPAQIERMGVNARLFEPEDIAEVPIRRFDGADTWTFLD